MADQIQTVWVMGVAVFSALMLGFLIWAEIYSSRHGEDGWWE